MKIHQKAMIFFEKKNTMKACFKAIILSIKIYKNILKFNFLMDGGRGGGGGMGVLDILTADAMKCRNFYRYKKEL